MLTTAAVKFDEIFLCAEPRTLGLQMSIPNSPEADRVEAPSRSTPASDVRHDQKRSPGDRALILEAGRADSHYWAELWSYRELFAILAWRDVAVQFKQTVIGVAWAVVRPLVTMLIFTVVFGRLARLPSEGTAPYCSTQYTHRSPNGFHRPL